MVKTICTKLLTFVFICTMVFAGCCVPAMAEETSQNLISNPSFEENDETKAVGWNYTDEKIQTTGGYENGAYLLSNSEGIMAQKSIQSLNDNSMVRLQFQYKMSTANSLSVLVSLRDDTFKTITNYTDRTYKPYVLSAESWTSFTQDIYLPKGAVGVQITVSATVAGVAVDDFSLMYVEEGNLLTNGNFNTGSITESEGKYTDSFGWSVYRHAASASIPASVTLADDENGGKCIAMSGLTGNGGIYQEVRNMTATTYKLSFKFKNTYNNSTYVRILWGNSASDGVDVKTTGSNNKTWQTYTIYFSWNTAQSRNLWIKSAYAGTNYIDDIVLTPISDAELRFFSVQPNVSAATGGKQNALWVKGKEKTDLTTGNTYALALFNPAVITTGNVMLGVYDGKSSTPKLQDLAIGKLTVADTNYHAHAVMPISVPDDTSYIKALVWDSVSGLKPVKTPIEVRQ